MRSHAILAVLITAELVASALGLQASAAPVGDPAPSLHRDAPEIAHVRRVDGSPPRSIELPPHEPSRQEHDLLEPRDDGSPPPNAVPPPTAEPPPAPIRVRFRLADGVQITGELTACTDEGIDGSFGRRAWSDLHYEDVWRLFLRIHEAPTARDWVALGRRLLLIALDQPGAEVLADRAFGRAVRLDPLVESAIDAARADAVQARADRERAAAAAEEARLATECPEARSWPSKPWPSLTPDEQAGAVRTMRAAAAAILEQAGLQLVPVETEHFLFCSDMPRAESARWASQLDTMYARLAEQFGLDPQANIFWGKAVILVFNERDRFQLVEAESFGHLAPEWVSGICHPVGPQVFVNFYRQPDDLLFAAVLVHETVHGFMHRYQTPRRLPTWANEGFADYLASVLFRNSPVDLDRRRKGVEWVRGQGAVNAVLDMTYDDGTWPGPDAIGYDIGYLMVDLMIHDRPRAFGRWVDAVKAGKNWERALAEDFGVPRERLVDVFTRFYLVND